MSERKSPGGEDQQASDELFDRDYLSDSDSEFLAELDRVLSSEPDSSMELVQTEPPAESAQDAPLDVDLDDPGPAIRDATGEGEDQFDLAEDLSETVEAPFPGDVHDAFIPTTQEDQQAAQAQSTVDESTVTFTTEDTPPAAYADTDLSEETQELDWNSLGAGPDDTPQATASFDETLAEQSQDGGQAVAEDALEPTAEEPADSDADQTLLAPQAPSVQEEAATLAVAPPPPEAEPPATEPAPPPPQAAGDGGAMWAGAAALLGMLGLAAGGGGLWMANAMDARMAKLEMASRAQAPLAAAAADVPKTQPLPVAVEPDDSRVAALEQSAERLGREFAGLSAKLESTLAAQDSRVTQSLGEIQDGLGDLQERLQGFSADIGALDRRLTQAESVASAVEQTKAPPAPARVAEVVQQAAQPAPSASAPDTQPTSEPPPAPSDSGGQAAATSKQPGWSVNLQSFVLKTKAEAVRDRLNADGIPAVVSTAVSKGKTWYRVKVSGFPDFTQAKAYADSIREKPGLSSAWIGRD